MEAPLLSSAVAQDDGGDTSLILPSQDIKSHNPHISSHTAPSLNQPVKQKFLFGHTDVVIALEVSHNGLLLATGQKVTREES